MRFAKGVAVGALVTAGVMMMYSDGLEDSKKKMIKKGKQIMRKMR